jgi:hypothetical protein
MKILSFRFLLVSAAVLALALPAASEPIMWYVDEEEIIEDESLRDNSGTMDPGLRRGDEGENRPVAVVPAGNVAVRAQRAGAVVPAVGQPAAGARNQVLTRQPNFQNNAPQGRAVAQRGGAVQRSAVPTAQRNMIQQRGAAAPRGQVQAGRTAATGRSVATRGGAATGRSGTASSGLAPSNLNAGRMQEVGQAGQAGQPNAARAVLTGSPIAASSRAITSRTAGTQMIDQYSAERTELETLKVAMDVANEKAELQMQLDDACLAQYYGCMDDICGNVNDTLGRCACSPNAESYKEMAETLKGVNIQLQDAVRNIQYLGLTTDEVNSLFIMTEAELALQASGYNDTQGFGATQTSQLRDLILAVELPEIGQAGTTKASNPFSGGFMDFGDISGLDSFDFLGNNTRKGFNDIANMSGKDLYNASKQKCEYVLKECQKKKVDVEMIQAKYDVEIGKTCVVIRDELDDNINNAKNLVRNAKSMLERARFQVAQNQNLFDLKGCVAELDTCMTDEFVCGKDYRRCIDGTGKYVSADGKDVVPGADLALMQFHLWNGAKSNVDYSALAGITGSVLPFKTDGSVNTAGTALVVQMLASKIGSISANHATTGFCASVMRQCKRYSYETGSTDVFKQNNEVIKNYLYQALPKIMSAQNRFVADFQVSCMTDLQSCYQRQIQTFGGGSYWGASNNIISSSMLRTLLSACDSIGLSCAYAVYNDSDNFKTGTAATISNDSCGRRADFIDGVLTMTNPASPQQCLRNISLAPIQGLITCGTTTSTSTPPVTTQKRICNLCPTSAQDDICSSSCTGSGAQCANNLTWY